MMAQSYTQLPALADRQFAAWQQLIEARTGLDFSLHRSILQSGLHRALRHAGEFDVDTYFKEIEHQPDGAPGWQALIECIAIKETSFLRQPAAFELVRHYLYQRAPTVASLDLWSVGCATGEEAYGLAIAANDAIETQAADCCFGVVGSDICPDALRQARLGQFARRRLERLPDIMRRRYFVKVESVKAESARAESVKAEGMAADGSGGEFEQIVPSLRQRVCFMQANLLQIEQLPVLPMDVIFCQNVLVYFRRWRCRQVLDALAQRLKPGGLLVLGPGEGAHWHHPELVRQAHGGVTAWLRRDAA